MPKVVLVQILRHNLKTGIPFMEKIGLQNPGIASLDYHEPGGPGDAHYVDVITDPKPFKTIGGGHDEMGDGYMRVFLKPGDVVMFSTENQS